MMMMMIVTGTERNNKDKGLCVVYNILHFESCSSIVFHFLLEKFYLIFL